MFKVQSCVATYVCGTGDWDADDQWAYYLGPAELRLSSAPTLLCTITKRTSCMLLFLVPRFFVFRWFKPLEHLFQGAERVCGRVCTCILVRSYDTRAATIPLALSSPSFKVL